MRQEAFEWGDPQPMSESVPWLREISPAQWPVAPGWRPLLDRFWSRGEGQGLLGFLRGRLREGAVIYPPHPLRALADCGPNEVSVVIVGQDPYHGPGQAEGLAFSVAPGVRVPPSLRNIFKEIQRDVGGACAPRCGTLVPWVRQGVLLLNTCLTVEDGQPGSHAGKGWEALTDAVIAACSESRDRKVFMLWGAHAQKKAELVDATRHLLLMANHPSPLSALRGPVPFMGCGHFGKANCWLKSHGRPTIDWIPVTDGDGRGKSVA